VHFDPFDSPWKPAGRFAAIERLPAPVSDTAVATPPTDLARYFETVTDLRAAVDAHERAIIDYHLGKNRFNQRQTAKALGLSYDQLRHCLRRHGLIDRT